MSLSDKQKSTLRRMFEIYREEGLTEFTVTPSGSGLALDYKRRSNALIDGDEADLRRLAAHSFIILGRNDFGFLYGRLQELGIVAARDGFEEPEDYALHARIEEVSGKLLGEGNFREAAFNAYVAVIGEVKAKTRLRDKKGKPMDGEPLMRLAFDCENNRTPVVRFNDLKDEIDRDEQQGFMHLFLGLVRLRHTKAHAIRRFNDARRAQEYLCLASLLMRLLDMATVEPTEPQETAS